MHDKLFVKFFHARAKYWKDNKHNNLQLAQNFPILVYFSLRMVCSSKLTLFARASLLEDSLPLGTNDN